MALSTKPYKGARDFYPEDKRLQKYMFDTWRKVAEAYGYEEYDAPILEPLDIYLAKTGEEIVNEQTYIFEDRGGRKVVIRPEMTPTVSRMVAGRRQELAYPVRWYSIPNLWRYERPQRGRLREHWQLNADIFGVKTIDAELEMITLVNSVFRALGATEDMYEIRVNHRGLINFLLEDLLRLSKKSVYGISKLIDRMQKMDKNDFIATIDEILSDQERELGATESLLAILEAKELSDLPSEAKETEAYEEVNKLLQDLHSIGMNNVLYDPTLMRGFDYYTGIVFEAYDKDPDNSRSMMGGGRYDALVGLFGVEPVPTVGFGWGDVTLANFLSVHSLIPDLRPEADLYVVLAGIDYDAAYKPIETLRGKGLRVAVDLSGRKLGAQLSSADKKKITKVLIIGEEELSSGQYKLKDLESGHEKSFSLDELVGELKD